MQIFPRRQIEFRLFLTALACSLFSLPFIVTGKALIVIPFVFAAGGLYYFAFYYPKYLKRRSISKNPLTDEDRKILAEWVSFYSSLSNEDKHAYEADIAIFLSEHTITGVDDVEITRKIELLVAATAIRLIFNRPEWEYRDFGDILIYPGGFRTDGSYSTDIKGTDTAAAGLVHSAGNVILSLPHLLRGFQHDNDGYNVGYHEFAHILDGYHPDGVPSEISLGAYRPWVEVMQAEFEKVHAGKSMLRQYAGTNPAEFFACSVEAFFEKPIEMKKKAPELYNQLAEFFNQKP
ncbi:MAG: zinc-dependent peptidase [Candidatus Fermentibacteraceae bacterium]|nr:zinc-dependent peptidase [Candidatus Fermentibacteraceae bacterium]